MKISLCGAMHRQVETRMKFLTTLNLALCLAFACHANSGWDTLLRLAPDLPQGIKPGLGLTELEGMLRGSTLRPIRAPNHGVNGDVFVTTYDSSPTGRSASIYRFKNGLLRALTLSETSTSQEAHLRRVKFALSQLSAAGSFEENSVALRLGNTSTASVEYKRWKSKTNDANGVLFATSGELTVSIFDPQIYVWKDFVVGVEQRDQIDEQLRILNSMISSKGVAVAKNAATDLLPVVESFENYGKPREDNTAKSTTQQKNLETQAHSAPSTRKEETKPGHLMSLAHWPLSAALTLAALGLLWWLRKRRT